MGLVDFLDNRPAARPARAAPVTDPRATAFHRSIPGYAPTPLAEAPAAAARLGLARVHVKLELERLGLPAFKVLGASWAACRALSERAGRDEPAATFAQLRALAATLDELTLVAATDGNHGRAVARVARMLGLGARILVPAHIAPARAEAIAAEGAEVELVGGGYDDAVARAATLADARHLVVSDTSWAGYEAVPSWVADGYATIFAELREQRRGAAPALVAIQIGVGALASAAVRALAAPGRVLVGVEPADAGCALAAVRAGAPVRVAATRRTIMAGLDCGLASRVALPDMAAGIDAFCTIDDEDARAAVRLLHRDGLAVGETGASGLAGLLALRERWHERSWRRLGLDERPPGLEALVVATEAPTDPASFRRIVAGS